MTFWLCVFFVLSGMLKTGFQNFDFQGDPHMVQCNKLMPIFCSSLACRTPLFKILIFKGAPHTPLFNRRHAAEHLLVIHINPGSKMIPTLICIQVGDGHVDHSAWGRPEEMTMSRPSFYIDANNGGSDLAGETAAALAAGSLAFVSEGESRDFLC